MIGYGSLPFLANLFLITGLCHSGLSFEGFYCYLMAIAPAVWLAGIFVGIIQLSAWSSLVRLSRRSIRRYALAWTGIMLMIPLLWIAFLPYDGVPIEIRAVLFLLSGMALFYPAIAGAALLFSSPTK
jgi:hypothetical protein